MLGLALQSYSGEPLLVSWAVPASAFPGGQRTQAVTVNLVPPGSKYAPRWNQLDISVRRIFKMHRLSIEPQFDVFNLLNLNPVLIENQNFGPTLGQPREILIGRIPRIAVQVNF